MKFAAILSIALVASLAASAHAHYSHCQSVGGRSSVNHLISGKGCAGGEIAIERPAPVVETPRPVVVEAAPVPVQQAPIRIIQHQPLVHQYQLVPQYQYVQVPQYQYVRIAAPAPVAVAPAPAVAVARAPAVAVAPAPAVAVAAAPAGPIAAAIQSRRTVQVIDIPSTGGVGAPQSVVIPPSSQPIDLEFQSQTSPVSVRQTHIPGQAAAPQFASHQEEADVLKQEVVKPVIHEVVEAIQPYRKITQEVRPVQEAVTQLLARGQQAAVPAPVAVQAVPAPAPVAVQAAPVQTVAVEAAPAAVAVEAAPAAVAVEAAPAAVAVEAAPAAVAVEAAPAVAPAVAVEAAPVATSTVQLLNGAANFHALRHYQIAPAAAKLMVVNMPIRSSIDAYRNLNFGDLKLEVIEKKKA